MPTRHVAFFALALIAAALVAVTVPPIPSLQAMSMACQAGPTTKCCSCGEQDGEPFCKGGAYIGAVSCSGSSCPDNPACMWIQ